MSDTLIATIVVAFFTALPPTIVAVVALIKVLRRMEYHARDVEQQLDGVREHATLNKEKIDMIATGAYRMGHVDGVKYVISHSKPGDLE